MTARLEHLSFDCQKERRVETGSGWCSLFRGWEQFVLTLVLCVRSTLERPLRDKTEYIFSECYDATSTERFPVSAQVDTALPWQSPEDCLKPYQCWAGWLFQTSESEILATSVHMEVSTHASPIVVLLTDALSVLQALQLNRDTEHNDQSAALALLCRGHAVTLEWIPSHCNVPGNKAADSGKGRHNKGASG